MAVPALSPRHAGNPDGDEAVVTVFHVEKYKVGDRQDRETWLNAHTAETFVSDEVRASCDEVQQTSGLLGRQCGVGISAHARLKRNEPTGANLCAEGIWVDDARRSRLAGPCRSCR
jgi:hypothetical protein